MDEFGLDEENDDNDETIDAQDQPIDEEISDCVVEPETDD